MSFGTFICEDCSKIHEETFSQFQCYIKPLFLDAWDNFQINCVRVGGNKRFFEFLRDYNKERDSIHKKYDTTIANFYRKRLSAEAKSLPFTEIQPAKSLSEEAKIKLEATSKFFSETNQKYAISAKTSAAADAITEKTSAAADVISAKTSAAAASVSSGAKSLWARAKTLTFKKDKPADEPIVDADSAAKVEGHDDAPKEEIVEESKKEETNDEQTIYAQ